MQKISQHFRPFFTRRLLLVSVFNLSLLAVVLLQVPAASARSLAQNLQGSVGVSQNFFSSQGNTSLSYYYTPVVGTPALPAGTYLVTATELAAVDTGDDAYCYIQSAQGIYGTGAYGAYGPASSYQWATIPVTDLLSVSAGDRIELLCADYDNDTYTYSYNAEISAIPYTVAGSNSNVLAKRQRHKPTPPPQLHH